MLEFFVCLVVYFFFNYFSSLTFCMVCSCYELLWWKAPLLTEISMCVLVIKVSFYSKHPYETIRCKKYKTIHETFTLVFLWQDIIDRLIILNSEAKIHSLFNYEQSHIFGLR